MKTPTLNHNPQHTSPKPPPCRKPGNFGPCGGGREGGREGVREGWMEGGRTAQGGGRPFHAEAPNFQQESASAWGALFPNYLNISQKYADQTRTNPGRKKASANPPQQ